ncbi:MAG: L-2-hydroxyglutarate oxidase [Bacteriovoracales bacterium]|nr:L-2-hydroxyglutarate oxidase [Bacteriovoracales bacterium]
MMKNSKIIIIGGGVVGLATAWQTLLKYHQAEVIVLEKEGRVAFHQSGRNSGVIHSGIYYKPGSLKAQNCLRGYRLLVQFCEEYGINFKICGKLIVADSAEQMSSLEKYKYQAGANGLEGVTYLSKEEVYEKEPHVQAERALWVPQAGTVDFSEFAQKLSDEIVKRGGKVHLNEEVIGLEKTSGQTLIKTTKDEYRADTVINCGGLFSDHIGSWTEKKMQMRIIPFRGEYYQLTKEKAHLINTMVYPTPENRLPFWGLHFHRNMHNIVEVGPSAVWAFKREGYRFGEVDLKNVVGDISWPGFRKVAAKYWDVGLREIIRSISKTSFLKAAQKIVPSLQKDDLIRGKSGVRAQACDLTGGLLDDFCILKREHIIHVCNAPSPAATSSLSIGKSIAEMI